MGVHTSYSVYFPKTMSGHRMRGESITMYAKWLNSIFSETYKLYMLYVIGRTLRWSPRFPTTWWCTLPVKRRDCEYDRFYSCDLIAFYGTVHFKEGRFSG